MKKRYALVGVGYRSRMFTKALLDTHREHGQLVGMCDVNPGRMQLRLTDFPADYGPVPMYAAEDFDRMISETKPDVVIVTTVDCFHDMYIVRAMELGCDAVTEKPMTIDAEKCQRIVDTARDTGRKVRVTFNYRYSPPRSQVKELLMEGTIGKVLSVDFHWMLDTDHGADYYRRWHRNKKNSGGLMVHKATHHFDLVNWWISSTPKDVVAFGKRQFYTPEMAKQYGLDGRGERCMGCPVSGKCRFFLDLPAKENLRKIYLEQEKHDGYFRDRCVFSEQIDIEDSMNVVVRYKNGVIMSYSLNSFMPWEGYTIRFNGTKGRLEHQMVESTYISGDGRVPGEIIQRGTQINVFPHFGEPYGVPIRMGKGGHGGGDSPLLDDVFSPNPPADPLKRAASHVEGAWSILTGIAANRSMETGRVVHADKLVKGIPKANYTDMKEW
jgi:predicted dehydrogenase